MPTINSPESPNKSPFQRVQPQVQTKFLPGKSRLEHLKLRPITHCSQFWGFGHSHCILFFLSMNVHFTLNIKFYNIRTVEIHMTQATKQF